ncbi:MAG TPA: NAD(P)H-dependent glycerol-3-phosphate dehydrogenase [Patescibacteria group bacterium]|nr:NAD(P)H-dependent glycerol-3-phosphate dehydrogenase [Patescibacteria group bacterium]
MKITESARVAVLGDGGWGTTLALLLNAKGHRVTLWGAFPEYVAYLKAKRINSRFLPQARIPAQVHITADLTEALAGKELVVLAIPSQFMRQVLRKASRSGYCRQAYFVSVTKGIEIGSLKRMSEVIHDELGNVKLAVLSGPTIAYEVAMRVPTTAVIASHDEAARKCLQGMFMTERFRMYTNDDVIGVELGGSLKNVIAIACGISDGLKFGTNTKAALLSRGLVEIARLGQAMGAKVSTFSGISGLGDLVTTCISLHSRNRFVGDQIGKGRSLRQISSHMRMIAEGVPTAKSAYALSRKYKIEMPITREVYSVLYKNKSPLKAVRDLMTRAKKEE